MKTPEEIKKGLERCQLDKELLFVDCSHCPYYMDTAHCDLVLHADAIAYIHQLESRLAQVEREKDAAIHDMVEAIKEGSVCTACRHENGSEEACYAADCDCSQCAAPCMCKTCEAESNYVWRGVCEENTKEG